MLASAVAFGPACESGASGAGDGATGSSSGAADDDPAGPTSSDAEAGDVSRSDSGDGDGGSSGEAETGEPPPSWPTACEADAPYPSPEWPVGAPEDHGFDAAALESAAAHAQLVQSQCLLVVRHGAIVFERYWMDTDEATKNKSWSVAKSYTSAIVGIALAKGDLGDLDDSVAEYLPELAGSAKESVTLRHLLTMTAGIYADLIDDMVGLFTAPDMTDKALAIELSGEPGATWQYANAAVQMFEPIFRAAVGVSADEYAHEHLFERIGMDAEWNKDMAGNPSLYMNVLASCRDHAKFGYLYLRDGCWDREQIVPKAWVVESTEPSTELNRGYGYYWWLSGGEPTLDFIDSTPLARGTLHPGGPDDSFCAVGLGSQVIEVVPGPRHGDRPHGPLGGRRPRGQPLAAVRDHRATQRRRAGGPQSGRPERPRSGHRLIGKISRPRR